MQAYRDDFWHFERAGWDKAAEHYEDVWVDLTRSFVVPLLRAAGVTRGKRVLDVACGPGYVSEAALRRPHAALPAAGGRESRA